MPIKIDYQKCNGCGRCYELCPPDVFTWDEELDLPKVTYEEVCGYGGICFLECPKRAIDVTYPAEAW